MNDQKEPDYDRVFSDTLAKVKRVCRNHTGIDHESITVELILEYTLKGKELYGQIIRSRCFDSLRKLRRELRVNEAYSRSGKEHTSYDEDIRRSSVALLIKQAELTVDERLVLYEKFWLSLPNEMIAKNLRLPVERVRTLLWSAGEKMKEVERKTTSNDRT